MHLGIVVPLYNEEAGLLEFHAQLVSVLERVGHPWTLRYVNDGSTDGTAALLQALAEKDERVRVLELSRNFGHQIALTAGLDHVEGEAVLTLDGDGQHPPELIPQLLGLYEQGFDVVLTQRRGTADASRLKRWTSRAFYQLLNWLSQTSLVPGSADFRLMSRDVVDGLRQVREQHRFVRGIVAWMGYSSTVLPFDAPPRRHGKSKFSMRKMLHLASDAIFSFSTAPLKIAVVLGILLLGFAALELLWVLYLIGTERRAVLVPGWTSLMLVLLGIGGVQLILTGVLGQYLGYIFQEVKKRPLYFVKTRPSPPPTRPLPPSGGPPDA